VVVPAVGVRVLLDGRLLGDGLEGDNIGLRWGIAANLSVEGQRIQDKQIRVWSARNQRCIECDMEVVMLRCLKPPHQHGPISSHPWEYGLTSQVCVICTYPLM
jgi:hypothetical protein